MDKRIQNEINELLRKQQQNLLPFTFDVIDLYNIKMHIDIKDELCPYNNQKHTISFKLRYGHEPDIYTYPTNPPLINFDTKILHPNISMEGSVCMNSITDSSEYSVINKIEYYYNHIIVLLNNPNPDSPKNIEAANLYNNLEKDKIQKEKEKETKKEKEKIDEPIKLKKPTKKRLSLDESDEDEIVMDVNMKSDIVIEPSKWGQTVYDYYIKHNFQNTKFMDIQKEDKKTIEKLKEKEQKTVEKIKEQTEDKKPKRGKGKSKKS